MTNGLKNNPLACGLLGLIIGTGGTLGGQALFDSNIKTSIASRDNFEVISYDKDGDVYITQHGSKFHDANCYYLRKAKKIQKVRSTEAAEAGLEPCTKCLFGWEELDDGHED